MYLLTMLIYGPNVKIKRSITKYDNYLLLLNEHVVEKHEEKIFYSSSFCPHKPIFLWLSCGIRKRQSGKKKARFGNDKKLSKKKDTIIENRHWINVRSRHEFLPKTNRTPFSANDRNWKRSWVDFMSNTRRLDQVRRLVEFVSR